MADRLPGLISHQSWHLTSAPGGPTGVDFYFEVPGDIAWTYPENARIAIDPCTQQQTLIVLSADPTILPPRTGRFPVRLHNDALRNARLAVLKQLWAQRGPYTLQTPSDTLTVWMDPTLGALEERWQAGARQFMVGFREVTLATLTPSPLPPLLGNAGITWTNVAQVPGVQVVGTLSWTYSGNDQTSTDGLLARQLDVTSEEVAGGVFDMVPPYRWFWLCGTNGAANGAVSLGLSHVIYEGFPDWYFSYYHQHRGLLPADLFVPALGG